MGFLNGYAQVVAPDPGTGRADPPYIALRSVSALHDCRRWPGTADRIAGCDPHNPAAAASVFEEGARGVGQEADAGEGSELRLELPEGLDRDCGIDRTAHGNADESGNIGADRGDRRRTGVNALVINSRC